MWTFRTPSINVIQRSLESPELGGILASITVLNLKWKLWILRKYSEETIIVYRPYSGIFHLPHGKKETGQYSRNWYIVNEWFQSITLQVLSNKLQVKEIINDQNPLSQWLNFKLYKNE